MSASQSKIDQHRVKWLRKISRQEREFKGHLLVQVGKIGSIFHGVIRCK